MKLPVVVIGFGGHGHVVASALTAAGRQVIAATELKPEAICDDISGIEVITDEMVLERYAPTEINLVLGIGSVWPTGRQSVRRKTIEAYRRKGFTFLGVNHPAAWIAPNTILDETTQIHAGAIVQTNSHIGAFTIVNTNASVDHDCTIGDFCHIGPGTTLSGNVNVGGGSHLGTGSSVIQGVSIGECSFVAAGATVVRDIAPSEYVRGTPAKPFIPSDSPSRHIQ